MSDFSIRFKTHGNEKQKLAFQYLLGHPEITSVGYGGGAGGGKSYTIVGWIWMMCVKYPGTRWFIARNELKRLKESTLVSYFKFVDDYGVPEDLKGTYNAQDSKIKFKNKSEIILLDASWMPSDPLYTRFGSMEFTGGAIDEAAEIKEQAVTILSTRVGRHLNVKYSIPPKVLETFNPDKGHVYRRFYDPYRKKTLPEYRVFIPALATDNKLLPNEYVENLKRADEVTKQRLLYGNFEYDDSPGRLFDYKSLCALPDNLPKYGEKVVTVDVAREGKDKSVIMVWNGYCVTDCVTYDKNTIKELAQNVREICRRNSISVSDVIADESGVGGGLVDDLGCVGFKSNARQLETGANVPQHMKLNYENLKSQCVHRASQAVNRGDVSWKAGKCDELIEELDTFVRIDIDKDGPFRIIRKEDQKEKLGRSPDFADAFCMRFMFSHDNSDNEVFSTKRLTFPGLGYSPFDKDDEETGVYRQKEDWGINISLE